MKNLFKVILCLLVVVALYGIIKQNVCLIKSDMSGCYNSMFDEDSEATVNPVVDVDKVAPPPAAP